MLKKGGDTDTNAAIVGGLIGIYIYLYIYIYILYYIILLTRGGSRCVKHQRAPKAASTNLVRSKRRNSPS